MPAEKVRILEERIASGKYSPDQVKKARRWIDDYQSQVASSTSQQLGDPRALSGVEALEANPLMQGPEMPEPTAQQTEGEIERKRQQAAALLEQNSELQRQGALPNRSKLDDPAFLRPSELKAESGTFGSHFSAIPFLGRRIWYEPTADQFRREVPNAEGAFGEMWGDDEFVRNSDQFLRYADAKWVQAYDQAAQRGTPIVRQALMDDEGVEKAFLGGMKHVLAAGLGVDEALTAGALSEIVSGVGNAVTGEDVTADTRALRESSTGGRIVGNVAGALSPVGLAGKLGAGAAGLTKVAGAQGLGRIGRAAGAGALASGAQAGAEEGVRLGSDVLQGEQVTGDDLTNSLERVAMDTALGGALGPAFDAMGRRAGAYVDRMRQKPGSGEKLITAESAGVEVNPIPLTQRFKESSKMRELRQEAMEAGLRSGRGESPSELVAERQFQPLAQAAYRRQEDTLKPLAGELAAYKAASTGERLEADELGDAVIRNLEARLGSDRAGKPLPGVETKALKDAFESTFEVRHIMQGDTPPAKAQPISDLLAEYMGIMGPRGSKTYVKTRRMNPEDVELVSQRLSKRAGHTTGADPQDPVFRELDMAVRRMRDRFAPPEKYGLKSPEPYLMEDGTEVTGWSAMNARYSQAKRGIEDANVRAGLPDELSLEPQKLGRTYPAAGDRASARAPSQKVRLSPQEETKARDSIRRYRSAEGRKEQDEAVRELASMLPGVAEELDALAATKAVDSLSATSGGSMFGYTPGAGLYPRAPSGWVDAARLRAYPIAKGLNKGPLASSPDAPKISDALRGILKLMSREVSPRALIGSRGPIPKPADYGRVGLRGGAGPAVTSTAAVSEQTGDANTPPMDEDVLQSIQTGSEKSSQPTEKEAKTLQRLLNIWESGKKGPPQ